MVFLLVLFFVGAAVVSGSVLSFLFLAAGLEASPLSVVAAFGLRPRFLGSGFSASIFSSSSVSFLAVFLGFSWSPSFFFLVAAAFFAGALPFGFSSTFASSSSSSSLPEQWYYWVYSNEIIIAWCWCPVYPSVSETCPSSMAFLTRSWSSSSKSVNPFRSSSSASKAAMFSSTFGVVHFLHRQYSQLS